MTKVNNACHIGKRRGIIININWRVVQSRHHCLGQVRHLTNSPPHAWRTCPTHITSCPSYIFDIWNCITPLAYGAQLQKTQRRCFAGGYYSNKSCWCGSHCLEHVLQLTNLLHQHNEIGPVTYLILKIYSLEYGAQLKKDPKLIGYLSWKYLLRLDVMLLSWSGAWVPDGVWYSSAKLMAHSLDGGSLKAIWFVATTWVHDIMSIQKVVRKARVMLLIEYILIDSMKIGRHRFETTDIKHTVWIKFL